LKNLNVGKKRNVFKWAQPGLAFLTKCNPQEFQQERGLWIKPPRVKIWKEKGNPNSTRMALAQPLKKSSQKILMIVDPRELLK